MARRVRQVAWSSAVSGCPQWPQYSPVDGPGSPVMFAPRPQRVFASSLIGIFRSVSSSRSVVGVAAERRQIVAHDDGVDAAEEAVAGAEVAEGELAAAGVAQHRARHRQTERRDRAQRVVRSISGSSPNGVPGRGLRKLSGTSCGSSSASCAASSARCSSDSPMPTRPPQHSSMPAARTISQVCHRSSYGVGGDHRREVDFARPRGCGCSDGRPSRRSSIDLLLGEHAQRARDIDLDGRLDRRDAVARPASSAARRGRAPRPRCRTPSRRSPPSPRPPPPAAGMSSQTERTGDVNTPDWLQKWQSSGQPPVLRLTDALDLDLRAAPPHANLVREVEQVGRPGRRGAAGHRPGAARRGRGRRHAPSPGHPPRRHRPPRRPWSRRQSIVRARISPGPSRHRGRHQTPLTSQR